MNPKIATLWADALESGAYKQATGRLVRIHNKAGEPDDRSFCCLGVLCNLHAQAHPEIAEKQKDPNSYLCCSNLLPEEVREWAGMLYVSGTFAKWDAILGVKSLASANDNGYTFPQIAKIIREKQDQL